MRCDLHVHTLHSGPCTIPLLRHVCKESYNEPLAVYHKLKRLGMDLVTVTDHDSIDAVEVLRSRPDFFLSEEATCTLPSGTELHVGIYDITERDHIEIQRRRHDFESLAAWLRERGLFFSANHVFSRLTGRRVIEDFELFERLFPALETRNGHMLARANENAATLADLAGCAEVGGSDAHAIYSVGSTWTVVPGRPLPPGLSRGTAACARPGARRLRQLLEAHTRRLQYRSEHGAERSQNPSLGAARRRCTLNTDGQLRRGELVFPLVDGTVSPCPIHSHRFRKRSGGGRLTLPNTMLRYIARRDHSVMRRVNRWHAPRWIRVWMICATRGGDGWLWYAMGLVILLAGGGQRFAAVLAAALAAALGIATFLRIKKATGRRRPCAIEPHCWATLLPPDQFSFPSGHTMTAFAVSLSLSSFYPDLAVGLMFCAVSIALSRILLGMHFLSDVLAGAAIGGFMAWLSVSAVTLF